MRVISNFELSTSETTFFILFQGYTIMQHYCKTQDSTSIYKQQLTQLSSWPNLNLDLPSILQNLGASLVPSLIETTIFCLIPYHWQCSLIQVLVVSASSMSIILGLFNKRGQKKTEPSFVPLNSFGTFIAQPKGKTRL